MTRTTPLVHATLFALCLIFIGSNNTGLKAYGQKWQCPHVPNIEVLALKQDSLIFESTLDIVNTDNRAQYPTSELIVNIAKHFLTTPYVAHTLELKEGELLVVNLREVDCTTFVEYVIAFALLIKEGKYNDFGRFAQLLSCIRYRDGFPDGYPSRLHYFSEWLYINSQKGLVDIISNNIGTKKFDSKVNFMSSNPHLYRQLSNPVYLDKIRLTEKSISQLHLNYIPKEKIPEVEQLIQNGDIIAFVTSIEGLDVSHTGFALHKNGRLHLIHASTRSKKVEISSLPLHDHIKPMDLVTGILIGRIR